MTYPLNSAFNLTMPEKVMLRAFITGTKLNDPQNADSVWTTEALETLNAILDNTLLEEPSSLITQDLFCVFTDLILRKDLQTKDIEFARIMAKFLHHLITLIDPTRKRKIKNKPGPRPSPQVSLEVYPQDQGEEVQESENP